jgi:hypothetical protein
VAIECGETSAAERAPNEVYIIDLETPLEAAFSRDERRIVWTAGGGLAFADAATGALTGTLLLTTFGRAFAVTDGTSFDWTTAAKSKNPEPLPDELTASAAGTTVPHEELASRRRPGLLAALV